MRLPFTRFVTAALMTVCAGVVHADERAALIVGNEVYAHVGPAPDAALVLTLADALQANGFTVNGGRNTPRSVLLNDIATFVDNAQGADRLAIVLTGHFVRSGATGWYLPSDSGVPELAKLPQQGVPVSLILDLAARAPGGALVALAQSRSTPRTGRGIRVGYGVLDAPQGVTIMTGPPRELVTFLRSNVLHSGSTMNDVVGAAGPDIRIRGFISRNEPFIPAGAGANTGTVPASGAQAIERAYWRTVKDINSVGAYEAYLENFPGGLFAGDAANRIAAIKAAPQLRAREAEDRLNLGREDRRQIQRDLSILGFDTRGIDGLFGPGTRGAIAGWQADRNLPATGYVSQRQVKLLRKEAKLRADQLAAEARQKEQELRAQDTAYWRQTGKTGGEQNFRAYLQRYPDGIYADFTRSKLDEIETRKRNKLVAKERTAWDAAVAKDNRAAYTRYLDSYPKGLFASAAKARIAELDEATSNRDVISAAKEEEERLNIAPVTRVLAEKKLEALGMKPGRTDGQIDSETRRAIRRFQRAAGLPVTGYLTRATIVRLIAS